MSRENKSRASPMMRLIAVVSALFITTATGGCVETDNSGYQEGAVMRNEIIAYVKKLSDDAGGKGKPQVDVTHLVEKYIKMGDSYETARDILLKNGFSIHEYSIEEVVYKADPRVKIPHRIDASYKMEGDWWYKKDIRIFLGSSPQSEKVDRILAKVNLKTV